MNPKNRKSGHSDVELRLRAQEIASKYRYVLEKGSKSGFVGSTIELPTVFGAGKNVSECEKDIRANIEEAVYQMLLRKATPPGAKERTLQLNMRVTPEEKLQMETAANYGGFASVSAFLRAAALDYVSRLVDVIANQGQITRRIR